MTLEPVKTLWLLIGENGSLPKNFAKLINSRTDLKKAAISGQLAILQPELSLQITEVLLDLNFQVYYTPIRIPNLLLYGSEVFRMQGDGRQKLAGLDSRSIASELRWSLSRKYVKTEGTIESLEEGEPGEVWIYLRNSFGYRNVVLNATQSRELKVGDSITVIGSYPLGAGDFPPLDAALVRKHGIG